MEKYLFWRIFFGGNFCNISSLFDFWCPEIVTLSPSENELTKDAVSDFIFVEFLGKMKKYNEKFFSKTHLRGDKLDSSFNVWWFDERHFWVFIYVCWFDFEKWLAEPLFSWRHFDTGTLKPGVSFKCCWGPLLLLLLLSDTKQEVGWHRLTHWQAAETWIGNGAQ